MRFLGEALEATASHWPLAKGAGWFTGAPLKWMKVGCPAEVVLRFPEPKRAPRKEK